MEGFKDFGEQMEIVGIILDDPKVEELFEKIDKAKETKNKVKLSSAMAQLVGYCVKEHEEETLRLIELATGKKTDEMTAEEAQKNAFGVLTATLGSFFA